uniref:AP-3 complex subunit delta-1 n=1 Tax=Aotus nancymaae TaxID=37293 RepID=A0A2K5E232_AOTNA
YLFHYICQDRIVYLCITDDDFERSRAFNFLNEIKKRFQTTYGSRAQTALPYAMNSEFSSVLAAQNCGWQNFIFSMFPIFSDLVSVTFKTTSRNLARAMCMKNLKLTIIIIIVSIVFIYIIVSPLCGGFTWPSCVKK